MEKEGYHIRFWYLCVKDNLFFSFEAGTTCCDQFLFPSLEPSCVREFVCTLGLQLCSYALLRCGVYSSATTCTVESSPCLDSCHETRCDLLRKWLHLSKLEKKQGRPRNWNETHTVGSVQVWELEVILQVIQLDINLCPISHVCSLVWT